ncbi:hypothetical protein ES708_31485 [subsurface metagenome]
MPRPIHFEICASLPERAARFYSAIFGWKIEKWEGAEDYWFIDTGEEGEPGINGALMRKLIPNASTINTIDVSSVDNYISRIIEFKGKVIMSKKTIPGIGYHAYCQDTEGNIFGIMEPDPNAK